MRRRPRDKSRIQRLQIRLPGGRSFACRIAGNGDTVLVLLHGIAGTCATWAEVIPPLARRYTVIAPDLIGHGASCKPEGDYTPSSYANALRDMLQALGHERVTLVGHSLGGGVAMQYAYQFPERCERLVIVSSAGIGREVHPVLRAAALPGAEVLLPWLSVAAETSVGMLAHVLGRLGLKAGADLEECWAGFVSLSDSEARHSFISTVRCGMDLHGQRVSGDELAYVPDAMPKLIIWGEKDPLIPAAHAELAHGKLRNSRVTIFPGVGHFPHREDPRAFVESIVEFVEGTQPLAGRVRKMLRPVSQVA